MQAKAASRICWYSTSDSVWAGATVIESPVCTPMGSTFSMEQTTTQLSARSRMTSSSNSFQPAIERSTRISVIGLASSPSAAMRRSSSVVCGDAGPPAAQDEGGAHDRPAGPPPSATASASSSVWAVPEGGTSRPIPTMAPLKASRSSAVWMASALAPISSTRSGRARRPRPAPWPG